MIAEQLAAHSVVAWVVAAILLGIAELAFPGVFLIFLAIAAAITGVALLALPDLPLGAQIASFAAWSIVAVLIGRRWYRDYPISTSDPLLNDRAARMVGAIVTVADAIENGHGRAILGDGTWPAVGPDAARGTLLRVAAVDGGVLHLEPLAQQPAGSAAENLPGQS